MRPEPDPHESAVVLHEGQPPDRADIVVVLVHGRGATAQSMIDFASNLALDGAALLAPQAEGYQWYPHSFLVDVEDNEPYLSSSLALLGRITDEIDASGPGCVRTMLLGFSQGACLMLEYAARNPTRFGAIAGLSGGLIGPSGTARDYAGSLGGTPVFLGCGDRDPHIPTERVEETANVLGRMGAEVTMRIYPGMGHTVNNDEIAEVGTLIDRVRTSDRS